MVRFRAVGDGSDWIIAGGETPPQQAFLLGGLRPSTAYMVRVTASNAAGAAHRDYAFTTDGAPDDYQWYQRGHQVLSSVFQLFHVLLPPWFTLNFAYYLKG